MWEEYLLLVPVASISQILADTSHHLELGHMPQSMRLRRIQKNVVGDTHS